MIQTIQFKRRLTGPGVPSTLAPGEMAYNDTGNLLFIGDRTSSVQMLVSANRQVELSGTQTITGSKTINVADLKLTGGAGGNLLQTDGLGGLAWVTPPAGVSSATPAQVTAGTDDTTFISPLDLRQVTGADVATLTTTVKTIVPALNELKGLINAVALATEYVGSFSAVTGTIAWTPASGASGTLSTHPPAPANIGWLLIATTEGDNPAGGFPAGHYNKGDWVLSDGTTWNHLAFGGLTTVTASQVGVAPAVQGATDVQAALTAINVVAQNNTTAIATKANTSYVDSQDALRVLKAGDTLTGALVLPAAAPTLATHAAHKGYVDGQLASYITTTAGDARYVNVTGDAMTGQLSNTPAAGTAGFSTNTGGYGFYAQAATSAGVYTTGCGIGVRIDNANNYTGILLYNSSQPSYSLGLAQHADGTCWINQNAGGGAIGLSVAGNRILNVAGSGLYVTPFAANYGIDVRSYTGGGNGAAVIGWTPGPTYYGMSGVVQAGVSYSFCGNTGAFLSAGAWVVSDGNLKAVTGDLDPARALNAVNAILVKEYAPVTREARMYLYGAEGDEPLYGWIAQDVEAIIPIAVRDVGVPDIDLLARSALRRIRQPAPESREAEELAKGDVSVKAINDRYMLTTLWAAVQALSARVAELEDNSWPGRPPGPPQ